MVNITTCISDELARRVREEALKDKRSVSKWLEVVIEEYLKQKGV